MMNIVKKIDVTGACIVTRQENYLVPFILQEEWETQNNQLDIRHLYHIT